MSRTKQSNLIRPAALVAVFLALNGNEIATAAEPGRLRVLTYNIHHGEGVDGKLDLVRIAKIVRSESPDLVALQEVDQGTLRTKGIDQPAKLAQLTGMHVVFGKNIDFEGGSYGNAVLSKTPITSHTNLKLPSLPDIKPTSEREQRGALVTEVRTSGGHPILFIATHLDHRSTDEERFASATFINEWIEREHSDRAAILAGDLNARPQNRVLQQFQQMWHKSGSDEMGTVPVAEPRRQIDYILHRPANRWRVVEVCVLDEPVASDHRPLFAELELLPAG